MTNGSDERGASRRLKNRIRCSDSQDTIPTLKNDIGTVARKAVISGGLVLTALLVAGNDACNKNYKFASQASVSGTPSATSTSTSTPSPNETTEPSSPTPTPKPTSDTSSPTASPTSSSNPNPDATLPVEPARLLRSLSALGEKTDRDSTDDHLAGRFNDSVTSSTESQNATWLGKLYSDGAVKGVSVDSDGDGYTDSLEGDVGSDPGDPTSIPPPPVTNLAARLIGLDDDVDGLSRSDEQGLGTDIARNDTDGDGSSDGAEVLSKSDPLDPQSVPDDSDGDGLSDSYEAGLGTNPRSADSDGDHLRDDVELALGTHPLDTDSDNDGILDGREVDLGSDPLIPESN